MVFGHLDGDGLEAAQERGAAQLAPARSQSAEQLGLVPDAYLPELHLTVVDLAQPHAQVAKIGLLLTGEGEGDPSGIEGVLSVDQLDGQLQLGEQSMANAARLVGPLVIVLAAPDVILGGDAQ